MSIVKATFEFDGNVFSASGDVYSVLEAVVGHASRRCGVARGKVESLCRRVERMSSGLLCDGEHPSDDLDDEGECESGVATAEQRVGGGVAGLVCASAETGEARVIGSDVGGCGDEGPSQSRSGCHGLGVSCGDKERPQLARVGPNHARNLAWRAQRKANRGPKVAGGLSFGAAASVAGLDGAGRLDCQPDVRERLRSRSRVSSGVAGFRQSPELVASYEERRIAENALATENARRRLEVVKALSLEDDVRRQRTRIAAVTEKNMVSIERDHAKLKLTGNVAGLPGGGFAETVLGSDASGGLTDGNTISPNSSASMADYRKCQKDLLDREAEVEKLRAALERCGISADHIDKYDKSVWTDNIETFDALDAMYGDYVLEPEEFGDKLRLVDTGAYASPMPKTARAGADRSAPVSKSTRAGEVVDVPGSGTGGVSSGDAAHFRKTDGTLYTQLEALRWLGSYAYAGNKLDCGRSDADVARECNTTVGVLQKYRALKARFGLMQ